MLQNKIAYHRKIRGIKQGELAKMLGMNQSALSKIELGKTTFTVDKAHVIATIFDTTIDELIVK
ncbi:helix-turn-helix transcriptional regulator [Cytobacillus sp. IB215665]|uniref:helix-turn-helix transcriptional regulator n=1 Tax=Cytobacillus sp. IB215665 TaxID=3097357 RepID=UPI002A0ABEF1|nr:helix-turn-helix transcriptional regulator [Cytobacillus sp. IB215665]MDX8367825.1 helix-turn-helix transcriptional regulator [Cytobacillus sp. IB215665]